MRSNTELLSILPITQSPSENQIVQWLQSITAKACNGPVSIADMNTIIEILRLASFRRVPGGRWLACVFGERQRRRNIAKKKKRRIGEEEKGK